MDQASRSQGAERSDPGAPWRSRAGRRLAPARRRRSPCPAPVLRGPAPSGRPAPAAWQRHPRRCRLAAGRTPTRAPGPPSSTRRPRMLALHRRPRLAGSRARAASRHRWRARPGRWPRPAPPLPAGAASARASGHPPRSGVQVTSPSASSARPLNGPRQARRRGREPRGPRCPEARRRAAACPGRRASPRPSPGRRASRSRARPHGRPARDRRCARTSSGAVPAVLHERGREPGGQGPEPALAAQLEANGVALRPRGEPKGEARPCLVSEEELSPRVSAPLVQRGIEGHVPRTADSGTSMTPPVTATSRSAGVSKEARQALAEPFERRRSDCASPAHDDRRPGHHEADRRSLPARGAQERARGLDRLGLHLGRPATLRRKPKTPEHDAGWAEVGHPVDLRPDAARVWVRVAARTRAERRWSARTK